MEKKVNSHISAARRYHSPLNTYLRLNINKPYYLLAQEDIEGDTFETLEEWHACPYKYEIMNDAMKFKSYLRDISYPGWLLKFLNLYPDTLGLRLGDQNTPIFRTSGSDYIDIFINAFEKRVKGVIDDDKVPRSLINTDLGNKILSELKGTRYSELVFCHNALYYKSFVVKNNKLIGIRNWQYAGYYPPELEDIIHRYLEFI